MPVKCLLWYLVCAMCLLAVAPRLDAGLSPSGIIPCPSLPGPEDTEKIRVALERRSVERRLLDLGFSAEEITGRLDQLSDSQIHRAATALDQLKAGQDGEGVLIGILIIVLVIGVILPLFGIKVWR